MTKPSPLVNHKQGRERLQAFLVNDALKLCVISAPKDYGKSMLCEWLYEQIKDSHMSAFVQLNSLEKPPDIISTILNDLGVGHTFQRNLQACRTPASVSLSFVQGVQVNNSQQVQIDAISRAQSEDNLWLYYSDLFDAFVRDLAAYFGPRQFVLIIDNYEKCDPIIRTWTYKHLLKVSRLIPSAKIAFFCQSFEKENLDYPTKRVCCEYTLGPITDREELFEWLREHGRRIDESIESIVERALEDYSTDPMRMAAAIKILLPPRRLRVQAANEVPTR
ncbi:MULTISPECIES: ATP-binding protein [unclassified Bradyrhizobium]|uniref:ATP-binding protein n=1 Tax=unclassified Bradyrhizobium TaxID=2631580 RepID=UPI0020B1BE69|nr:MULTISPECIES: ATP-binding protein [unclassified Bradyrhizobium]MCP3380001.1 ATP-binding protein [Bradyrhizobium sp. CCGUVB4N]MCP3440839.1 ATP-binding protein [Bradyrhizobium sp. CCGUVB14]